jgi:tetratricopeptide (TPR) repeat protein
LYHADRRWRIGGCRTGNSNLALFLIATVVVFAINAIWLAPAIADSRWSELLAEGDDYITRQELLQAEDCYRHALKEVKRVPHSPDDLAKCLEKLASTLFAENDKEHVLPLYKKALHVLERAHGKKSPLVVPILYALGSIFEAEGDYKLAIKRYRRAVAINQASFGALSLELAESLHYLARAKCGAHFLQEVDGKYLQEAEAEYLLSLSIVMRQASLPSVAELESLLSDYIDLLRKLDIPSKNLASDFQAEMLKDRIGTLDANMGLPPSNWQKQVSAFLSSSDAASTKNRNDQDAQKLPLHGLAPSTASVNPALSVTRAPISRNFASSDIDYYERMIAIDVKALGKNHPTVADDLSALASVYVGQHRYADAKPLLDRALAIYETVYGKDNLLVKRVRAAQAYIARDRDNPEPDNTVYNDTSRLANIPPEAKRLEISIRLNNLGFICYCQGKLDIADTIYHWALASTFGATGNQSSLSAACLTDFAKVQSSLGQTAEANRMRDVANAILTKAALAQNILLY